MHDYVFRLKAGHLQARMWRKNKITVANLLCRYIEISVFRIRHVLITTHFRETQNCLTELPEGRYQILPELVKKRGKYGYEFTPLSKARQILVNSQLDAQLFFMYVYFTSLHVSSTHVLIIRRISCINTTSGVCHLHRVTYTRCRIDTTDSPDDEHMGARNM